MQTRLRLSILVWLAIPFITSAVAADTNPFDRAINAITNSLPSGWTMAEQKTNEIPWGHHWNESYDGPKGLLVIVKGVRPVDPEFCDTNGVWRRSTIHVATESLQIWLMPSNYSDSFWSKFSIDRPIQPTIVVNHGPIKVYAQPSVVTSQNFSEILSTNRGIRWPDVTLSWKDWRPQLSNAIKTEFAK